MRSIFFFLLIYLPTIYIQAQTSLDSKIIDTQFQFQDGIDTDVSMLDFGEFTEPSSRKYIWHKNKDSIFTSVPVQKEAPTTKSYPKDAPMQGIEGYILDGISYKPIEATITLFKKLDEPIAVFTTNKDGFFNIQVPIRSAYFLKLSGDNHHSRFKKVYYPTRNSTLDYFKVYLNPTGGDIEEIAHEEFVDPVDIPFKYNKGEYFLDIPSIEFSNDETKLTEQNIKIIKELVSILNANKDFDIEIAVHSDARGPESYIKNLTQKRADEIRNQLLENGLNPNRIEATGYGFDQLKNNCFKEQKCTEIQHLENRRVEYVILNQLIIE